jgi:transglutaminase/protease-like cytokinesis protein 3
MKKTFLLLGILLSFTFLKAQQLSPIDATVAQYPKTFESSEELAALINTDFTTDEDKARAIYSWITRNVEFDVKAQFSKKKKKRITYKDKVDLAQKQQKQRIRTENKALVEHKAVAEGYATLYKRLCDLTGIYGYILTGTAKARIFDIGKLPRMQNHSWNVIQIDKEWYFVDATMGAGTVDYTEKTYKTDVNDKYFFTTPELFYLNHFPKEKDWLLVEKTAEDFAQLPLFYGEYLKNEFELLEPLAGLLDLKGADSIQFRMKSPVSLEDLCYQFNYEKEASELVVSSENDEYTFVVPFTVKRRGYLTLYYKKKAIVSYKVNTY